MQDRCFDLQQALRTELKRPQMHARFVTHFAMESCTEVKGLGQLLGKHLRTREVGQEFDSSRDWEQWQFHFCHALLAAVRIPNPGLTRCDFATE